MSARPERIQAVLYGNEASFAEASPTIDVRLEAVNNVDLSGLDVEMIDSSFVDQYASGGYRVLQGARHGSFEITIPLTGHGTDPTDGTLTETALHTLLTYVIGGGIATNDGGTCTGGTTTAPTHTGAALSTYTGLLIGALGDGAGNGQAYFVTSESAGTINLQQPMEGTPLGTETIRAMLQVHPVENSASMTDVTSTAWRIQSANRQYDLHGCYPTSIAIDNLNARQRPQVTISFGVAWWEVVNETFATTAISSEEPAVVMNGSMHFDSGTGAAKYNVRDFSVSFNLMTFPQESSSASNQYQVVTGCKHGGCTAEIDVTVDALASGTETHLDDFYAENDMRLMLTLSSVPGKAVALYFPRLAWMQKPIQSSANGLNTNQLKLRTQPFTNSATDRAAAGFHLLMV